MPFLEQIILYPIKSLDGISVPEAVVSPGGALTHDREFAILDEWGSFVNGKRHERVHLLRAAYDLDGGTAALQDREAGRSFRFGFEEDVEGLEAWLGDFLGFRVRVKRNTEGGFPDDTAAWGPTVVSAGTLETVGSWFEGLSVSDIRPRFRANLEVGGAPAFWEDRLYGEAGTAVTFEVGGVRFEGVNPCRRCVVPSRDPRTGEAIPGFQKRFAERRAETLPGWASRSRFDHFYRLCVNTRIPPSEAGKTLRVGDEVRVVGP